MELKGDMNLQIQTLPRPKSKLLWCLPQSISAPTFNLSNIPKSPSLVQKGSSHSLISRARSQLDNRLLC